MPKAYDRALEEFLGGHAAAGLRTRSFGPKTAGLAHAELADYPHAGATTWVTIGMAVHERSLWRGLPLGFELVLTLAARDDDVVEMLEAAVLEDRRRALGQVDRRPMVEDNGVWAPGHPPHLVFIESPAVPDLMTRVKLGDRYVRFLAAVPIDDPELRRYDRDPAAFIRTLVESDDLARYPRGSG